LAIVDANYKKVAESAKKNAEKLSNSAKQLRDEANENENLIKSFNELKSKYDEGLIAKEDL